jgi:hypothetical protein
MEGTESHIQIKEREIEGYGTLTEVLIGNKKIVFCNGRLGHVHTSAGRLLGSPDTTQDAWALCVAEKLHADLVFSGRALFPLHLLD